MEKTHTDYGKPGNYIDEEHYECQFLCFTCHKLDYITCHVDCNECEGCDILICDDCGMDDFYCTDCKNNRTKN